MHTGPCPRVPVVPAAAAFTRRARRPLRGEIALRLRVGSDTFGTGALASVAAALLVLVEWASPTTSVPWYAWVTLLAMMLTVDAVANSGRAVHLACATFLCLSPAHHRWRRVPLTTRDRWRAPSTGLAPEDVAPYYGLPGDFVGRLLGLDAVEALVRAGIPARQARPGIWEAPHVPDLRLTWFEPLVRLVSFGTPIETVKQVAHHSDVRPADLLDLFNAVPDLTADDLTRWEAAGTLRTLTGPPPWSYLPLADALNARYAAAGERASWYAALGFTEEQVADAERAGVDVDTLRMMVGLGTPAGAMGGGR